MGLSPPLRLLRLALALGLAISAVAPRPCVGADAPDPKAAARRAKLAQQFDRGNRYALLVGVNAYVSPKMSPLRFCVSDAELLADVLRQRCGYPADGVVLLADRQPADRLPTRENIQRHLTSLLLKAQYGDTVLVFFAGHGGIVAGASSLCPTDFDPDNSGLTGVRVEHVRDLMHASKATQKLLVLDCCHSGATGRGVPLALSGDDLDGFKGAGGLITFAAARRSQQSQEASDRRHGLFTWALARGLGGEADADRDGIVDSDEVYRYVHDDVTEAARARGHEQTPVRILGEDVTGILALSRVAGEAAMVQTMVAGARVRNSVEMDLVLVMPGGVMIGSPADEAERNDDERALPARIGRPCFLGRTEVTQAQWERVMGSNPSWYRRGGEGASAVASVDPASLPVEQVSWEEATEFCRRLSALPAEQAAGRVYRLPTEGEWEYGCRAGAASAFAFGKTIGPAEANVDGRKPYLDADEQPGLGRPAPVGSYPPNRWGLCDMHGNVAEWVADAYTNRTSEGATYLPELAPSADARVTKGGSFLGAVGQSRSAARVGRVPGFRHRTLGFRVACFAAGYTDR
ncbi:MAG: SUMF1/EgtB/PvdO family nonheme iron enzyme [Planctomycetes bacterium]|nr:SUMF1/EgtB/PvdO family nonheme iron enzyme [Planctomycetota bacterium]